MNAPVRTALHQEMDVASRVAAALIAAGVEPDDSDYAELMASETDIQDRLVRILRAARFTEAQSKALGQLESDMRTRRDRLDAKAVRLRTIVLQAMSDLGLKRIEGPDLSASVGAGRAKVVVSDEKAIPSAFFVTSRSLDKKALAAALKDEAVPGASLSNGDAILTMRSR